MVSELLSSQQLLNRQAKRAALAAVRVEVTGLCQLSGRTDQVALREEFAWAHAQLTTYHMLVQTVVTIDNHLIDMCLWTLGCEITRLQVSTPRRSA